MNPTRTICSSTYSRTHTKRTLACLLVPMLWCAGTVATAHAGVASQGLKGQGLKGQGSKGQGLKTQRAAVTGEPWTDEWLHGPILVGVMPDQRGKSTNLIHLLDFRGDAIGAFVWTRTTGWQRRDLHPRDLIGMSWLEYRCDSAMSCPWVTYRIVAAERDSATNTMPEHGDNSDIWLYQVEYRRAGSPVQQWWRPACTEDRQGRTHGLFVNGTWRADGSRRTDGYTFACTSGVIAKCARDWGYKPWKRLVSKAGHHIDLRSLHQACVRAARADYCGDGISHTRDGTLIDMLDTYGLNVRDSGRDFHVEAGFAEAGATWVQRTRYPIGRSRLGRLSRLPGCTRSGESPRQTAGTEPETLITVWSQRH